MKEDIKNQTTDFDGADYFEAREFGRLNLRGLEISEKEFYKCTFRACDMSKTRFTNCEFEKCGFESNDLSLAVFNNTRLTGIEFIKCKLIGITWPGFKMPGDYNFDQCILDNSIVMGINWLGVKMLGCSAREIDFSETNLSKAVLTGSDFTRSRFIRADLTFADFTDAVNYSIDPTRNKLKKTVFSMPEVTSMLNYFDIIIK